MSSYTGQVRIVYICCSIYVIYICYNMFAIIFMYAIHIYHIYATTYAHVLSCFTCIQLLVTLWTVYGDSRQEYRSGLPCPPAGDLPNLVIEPISLMSPALAGGFFTTSVTWEAHICHHLRLLCSLASKCNLNSAN